MTRLLLAATLLLGAAPEGEAVKPGPAGPRIRVEPQSFDFGAALPEKTLRKEFTLRNFGDADLVIEGVTGSCICTAGDLREKLLKPGRSTSLTVSLKTRNHRGRLEQRVLVRSNDPVTPLLEIKVQATVAATP